MGCHPSKEKVKDIAGSRKSLTEYSPQKPEVISSNMYKTQVSNNNETTQTMQPPSRDLISDDIDKETREIIKRLSKKEKFMDDSGYFTDEFVEAARRLLNIYDDPDDVPESDVGTFQKQLGTIFAECEGVENVCNVVVYCINKGIRKPDQTIVASIWRTLRPSLGLLVNFSDMNPDQNGKIIKHRGFIQSSTNVLKKFSADKLHYDMEDKEGTLAGDLLSVIYNVSSADDYTELLRSAGIVEVLKPFLASKDNDTHLTALAALANIMDEKEAEKLDADGKVFTFLVIILTEALEDENRRCIGWSAGELARVVKSVARSDKNKRSLVEHGVVPLLVSLSESGNTNEERDAVGALWTLSFHEDNQDTILQEYPSAIEAFIRLRMSADKPTKKASVGGLWNMREKLYASEKYKSVGEEFVRNTTPGSNSSTKAGHVMLSYQWSYQNVIIRIRDVLRENNIKVWMDIDDMEGSTIDAMARAIEDAEIVLVCYSQKYKDSDNCRSEAEYAHSKKKKIIPLLMERSYKADGWLGFIIGSKLFYDFSGKYSFESRAEGLIKDIRTKQKTGGTDDVIIPKQIVPVGSQPPVPVIQPATTPVAAMPPPVRTSCKIRNWTSDDVKNWLDKYELPRQQFNTLTGKEIAFLQVISVKSPDFFYKTLTEMMKIDNLLTLANFAYAIEDTDPN